MSKPKKKGKLEKIGGKVVLVEEKGTKYEVTESTAEVWGKCNGKTNLQTIAESIAVKAGALDSKKRFEIEDAVYKTINQLEEAGLVERG